MNFAQIYGQVANYFDSQNQTNAKLWAVQASHELYGVHKWTWLETRNTFPTVSGQTDYVLAGATPLVPDFDGFISFRHNVANASLSAPRLTELLQDDFDEQFGHAMANTGIPTHVTLRGAAAATTSAGVHSGGEQVLSLAASPNYVGVGTLAYFRHALSVEMTADGDVPLAPGFLHSAIVDLAIARGLEFESQAQEAAPILARVDQRVQAAVRNDVMSRPKAGRKDVILANTLPPSPAQGGPLIEPGYRWTNG